VAAYQPIGAASLAASYVNLANPGTYNAAPGVAPGLAAGGWTFAAAQYLATGIVSAANWSMIVRCSGFGAALATALGAYSTDNNGRFYIQPRWTDNKAYFANGNVAGSVASNRTEGTYAIGGQSAYIDGSDVGLSLATGAWTAQVAIAVGALNNKGIMALYFSGTIAALAIYSTTLGSADVAALTTRMQGLA